MKVGPHIIVPTAEAIDWAKRAPIVKEINTTAALRVAQPGAITVHRTFFDVYEQNQADPHYAFEHIIAQLGGVRPTFVELHNEWAQRIEWGLAAHARFTERCVRLFHDMGQRVLGFSFSTGQPEMTDWYYLRDYVGEDGRPLPFCGVDAIGLHEYWAKAGFSTWNALRYRRVHDILGGNHPPFLISECGRDAIQGEGGEGQPGWKMQGVDGTVYVRELLAYAAEIEKDSYVLGCTPFTSGATPDWDAFNMDGLSNQIPGGLPSVQPPTLPQEAKMPEYTLGFKDYYDQHPEIGAAVSDLLYDANGTAVQYTERGRLEWCKQANKVYFFAAAA